MASSTYTGGDVEFHFEYTRGKDETVTVAVVQALSTATWADATEIPPLYETIDTDSLNRLCSGVSNDVRIEFTHHGFDITVTDGETIELRPTGE